MQLNLFPTLQADELAEQTLKDLEIQGIDPKEFLLRLLFRQTANTLHKFSEKHQEKFVLWIVEEFISND